MMLTDDEPFELVCWFFSQIGTRRIFEAFEHILFELRAVWLFIIVEFALSR